MRNFLVSILKFLLFHRKLCIKNQIFEKFFFMYHYRGATIIPRSLKTTRSTNFLKLEPLTAARIALGVNFGSICQIFSP
jgi:hypothetical protein